MTTPGSYEHEITIKVDTTALGRCSDAQLAMLWHVAQHNPAPHADKAAGELTGKIGNEIILRWLRKTPPEMYHHQQRDYHWSQLTRFAKWNGTDWVPKHEEPADVPH